jgi:hypothetical protein
VSQSTGTVLRLQLVSLTRELTAGWREMVGSLVGREPGSGLTEHWSLCNGDV